MLHGRIVSFRHESRVLKGNPLGDPHVRELLVYLPPEYDSDDRGARYPTVTLLPGFYGNHRSMIGYKPFEPNTLERFDRQVVAGECPPAILVLPDCTNRWAGSQFLDSTATGRYQTYLADEVLPFVDAELRTIAGREGRAIAGKSSGGFGALRLGMDRPDAVGAVASHAGDAAFEISMRPMLTSAAIAFEQAGGVAAFAERVAQRGPSGAFEFEGLLVLACSAAYAPEPDQELPHCALPFDPTTAQIDPQGWGRWLAHDPLNRKELSALKAMRTVFLDAGDRDEHGLCFAARLLRDRLDELRAPVILEEFAGGHRGTSFRYERSLPHLIGSLLTG